MSGLRLRVVDRVEDALHALDIGHRRVASGEWGLTVEAGGWPLDIGLALHAGGTLLRVAGRGLRAGPGRPCCAPAPLPPTPLVAFTATLAGRRSRSRAGFRSPPSHAGELDRLLGLLVAAAADVREQL